MSSRFAVHLTALRRARHLTLAALAVRAGIHATQIGRFERGLRPSLPALHRLAGALGVPPIALAREAFADLADAEVEEQ